MHDSNVGILFIATRIVVKTSWCIGQKVHLGFSITLYGKTQMDLLANSILMSVAHKKPI